MCGVYQLNRKRNIEHFWIRISQRMKDKTKRYCGSSPPFPTNCFDALKNSLLSRGFTRPMEKIPAHAYNHFHQMHEPTWTCRHICETRSAANGMSCLECRENSRQCPINTARDFISGERGFFFLCLQYNEKFRLFSCFALLYCWSIRISIQELLGLPWFIGRGLGLPQCTLFICYLLF